MKGSLIQRGTAWYAVVDLPRGADGKRRQKWNKLAATSKKKAQDELNKLLVELAGGVYVEPSKLTVADYLRKWLVDYAKVNVAAKTFERYEGIIKQHLVPNLGTYAIAKLQPLHIQEYYTKALQEGRMDGKPGGLSPQTILHHHRVLKEALQQAVRWQIIVRNPADAVEPPRATRKEMQTLTAEQIEHLLQAARGTSLHMPILLAIATGMRRGEILALRWQDVSLEAGTISICRSLEQTSKGVAFKEPKTARSRRVIALPAFAVEALRRHKIEQTEHRLRVGPIWEGNDLVCATERGRPVVNNFQRDYALLLGKAELPRVRFHDLRHSHATMLLGQGVHPKIVSERLGHSAIGITLDTYSHVLPAMQQEAAHKLDSLFKRAKSSHAEC